MAKPLLHRIYIAYLVAVHALVLLLPDGSIVFLGDSITQGLCVSAVSPLAVNFGIASDTTQGILDRLPKYEDGSCVLPADVPPTNRLVKWPRTPDRS